eukprot:TRINITY_DN2066_c0_g2_i2.p2 TRINITY_DN2066_c0_g2~~TRINITY_DN2066_c0_g2_i2.p2  ORF type:complete len:333 (+),score=90.80 TRINITY_DN2066_c0_g2_i2:46-999(+)
MADTEIRALIQSWREAFAAKDVDGMLANYAPDVVFFDLKPPFALEGVESVRNMWKAAMPHFPPKFTTTHDDLHIAVGADVAFASAIAHTKFEADSHETFSCRVTLGFRKIDGRWLVTHEHNSLPYNPETGKAAKFGDGDAENPAKRTKADPSPYIVGNLKAEACGDNELRITRAFDAPRDQVFDATTNGELMARWMAIPPGYNVEAFVSDPRPGGEIHIMWADKVDKTYAMGIRGAFVEADRAAGREVHTEAWVGDCSIGDSTVTTLYTENDGRTDMEMIIRYGTKEVRDGILKTGMMFQGMEPSYVKLDKFLADQQ